MTRRRKKWIFGLALFAVAIAIGLWISYLRLLPWIVRREVNAAFASVGLSNVQFQVQDASLFGTRLRGAGDDEADIGLGAVAIQYSPWDAINGELRSIQVSNARLEIDLDRPLTLGAPSRGASGDAAGAPAFDLPFERLELIKCALVLKRGDRELRLPIDGAIVRRATRDAADVTITSAIERSDLHVSGAIDGAAGSARFTASSSKIELARLLSLLPAHVAEDIDDAGGLVTFALDYRFVDGASRAAMQVALANAFIDAEQGMGLSISGVGGVVTFDDLLRPSTQSGQTLRIARLEAGGQVLADSTIHFQLLGANQLQVEALTVNWAGGLVRAQPFAFDPGAPVIATTVTADHVGLSQVVALVTQGRAVGDGTVSGRVPFTLDLRSLRDWQIHIGEGAFRADTTGTLRLGDASEDFGDLMAQSDPSFDTDPLKRELRESVVTAMRDFRYDLIEVGFRRTRDGEDVIASMKIHGRGRGGNRLPLHLGLNVEGLEAGLRAYLQTRTRVLTN